MNRKQSTGRKKKINKGTILIVSLLVIFVGSIFVSNTLEIIRLNQEKARLEKQIQEADKKTVQLEEDLKHLDSRAYIEYIARKYLRIYYPDEQIVVPVEEKQPENNDKNEQVENNDEKQPTP